MVTFELVRESMPTGTPVEGELLVEGEHFCYTIELPWRMNAPDVSCIPLGVYTVQMLFSPHFGKDMPHVLNVQGRSAVEMHGANSVFDLLGCVGLGLVRGPNATLAYPAHPASEAFNEWLISVGGTALLTITVLPQAVPVTQAA